MEHVPPKLANVHVVPLSLLTYSESHDTLHESVRLRSEIQSCHCGHMDTVYQPKVHSHGSQLLLHLTGKPDGFLNVSCEHAECGILGVLQYEWHVLTITLAKKLCGLAEAGLCVELL